MQAQANLLVALLQEKKEDRKSPGTVINIQVPPELCGAGGSTSWSRVLPHRCCRPRPAFRRLCAFREIMCSRAGINCGQLSHNPKDAALLLGFVKPRKKSFSFLCPQRSNVHLTFISTVLTQRRIVLCRLTKESETGSNTLARARDKPPTATWSFGESASH